VPIANFLPTTADYVRFLPELLLTLAGVLIMFLEALRPELAAGNGNHARASLGRTATAEGRRIR